MENVDWLDEEVAEQQVAVMTKLKCPFCGDLLIAAVFLPCCRAAACNECARDMLIADDHVCRLCKEDKVSPDDLIPKVFEFSNKATGCVTSSDALDDSVLSSITEQNFPAPDNLPVSDTPIPPDSTVTSLLECDTSRSPSAGPPTPLEDERISPIQLAKTAPPTVETAPPPVDVKEEQPIPGATMHGDVSYSCEKCDYKATRKGTLKRHIDSFHGDVRFRLVNVAI